MPDWNDPEVWAQAYILRGGRKDVTDTILPIGAGFGEDLDYLDGRKHALQLSDDGSPGLANYRFRLNKLGAVPAFTPSTDVLIVGCGFGWLIETILNVGGNDVWGTDLSTLIHANLATADVPQAVQDRVLNIDIQAVDVKDQFKAAGAGTNQGEFRWIVTEQLLEGWPTADLQNILDACDNLRAPGQGGVAHIIKSTSTVRGNPATRMDSEIIVNQLTFDEWIALRPAHWWVEITSGEVGGGQ